MKKNRFHPPPWGYNNLDHSRIVSWTVTQCHLIRWTFMLLYGCLLSSFTSVDFENPDLVGF